MALSRWYPGGATTRAPWQIGNLYRVPVLGSSSRQLYVDDSGYGPCIVSGAVGGRLTVSGDGGDLVPFGESSWHAGQWYFDGRWLLPAPGDNCQILVSWVDSLGNQGSQYVGTRKYYEIVGFNGTATTGTAKVMGEANDPDTQVTATWTYTPPAVWRQVSGSGETEHSAAAYGLDVAGRYEPLTASASGTVTIGQGCWWCDSRSEGVWEDAAGTGLLKRPAESSDAVPVEAGVFEIAAEARGRWTIAGMPTRGQGFTAAWEWSEEVPPEERVDPPADLDFDWAGYGLLLADNDRVTAGRVYAYDVVRMM